MTVNPRPLLAGLLAALVACRDSAPPPDGQGEEASAPVTVASPAPATPEPLPSEEARTITFRDLSLVGADVSGLLDIYFDPDADASAWTYPAEIQALDGQHLSLVGYMIALDYEGDDVTRFMLVRDFAACCMGGIPRPDEWVEVELATPCEYMLYRPVRAQGRFSVGIEWDDEGGLLASAFQLTRATAVLER